jgi:hypothetical protein
MEGAIPAEQAREMALASYFTSAAVYQNLLAKDSKETSYQYGYADASNRAGRLLEDVGRRDEALSSYRQGLPVAKALALLDETRSSWSNLEKKIEDAIVRLEGAEGTGGPEDNRNRNRTH